RKAKSKDILLFNHQGPKTAEKIRLGCKSLNPIAILCGRDAAKTCFCATCKLKRLGSFNRRQNRTSFMKMKKQDASRGVGASHKGDVAVHVGNKVLPIRDTALSSSTNVNDHCGTVEKREKPKVDHKTKTISKMKELLRWAAAAKAEKGGKYISRKVLHFRNRATLKPVPDYDQLSNESPKISFRWDVESNSTYSSVYSAMSMASSTRNDQIMNLPSLNSSPIHGLDQRTCARRGNWISTDSE
ncbi:hypothetical protein RJ639_034976, partial [Escallonia herrerae]